MRRLAALALLALVLVSLAPAYAEELEIDPSDPPPSALGEEEVARLAALQSVVTPAILSPISPDDAVFLAGFTAGEAQSLAFVAVADGARTPVDSAALDYPAFSAYAWADPQTLVFLSERYDIVGETLVAVVVSIDRASGALSTRDIELPGFPLSLAPDGARVLLALAPPEDAGLVEPVWASPFDLTLRVRPPAPPRLARALGLAPRAASGVRAFADEALPLAVLDLRSGDLTPVTDLPPGSELVDSAWSPDGARLAIVHSSFAGVQQDLAANRFVLSNLATQDALGRLDPANNPFFQSNQLEIYDLGAAGGPPLAVVSAPELGPELIVGLDWSTDGQTLLAQLQRPTRLAGRAFPSYTFPEDVALRFFGADGAPLGGFDRPELQGAVFSYTQARFVSPDELIFSAPAGLEHRLYYYNRRSGEFRVLPTPEGFAGPQSWQTTRLSRQLVFAHSSFYQPPELYRLTWGGQALYRLTWDNAELEALNQVRVNRLTFRLASGATREGYLVQPKEAPFPPRRAPIVVWQEGGPGVWMGNSWGANVENPYNLLANFGIGVLVLPLPGRDGYGPAFVRAQADGRNFGQLDIDEMAEIVRQLTARGWTAPGKVGLTGCSYGGYFTVQSIARHPGLYAAANPQCSWVELIVDFQFVGPPLNAYLEGATPQTAAAEYVRDSPLYNAGRITTPTLIFHGTDDFQPIELMQTLHDQIEANGAPVQLLTFLGEGHGLAAPSSQLAAAEAQLLWFRQYLGVE